MLPLFRRWPLWAYAPMAFVVLFVLWYGLSSLQHPHRNPDDQLVSALFYAVPMSVFVTVSVAVRRRRAGGTEQLLEMQRSLKTGSVPDDADPRHWTPQFERWDRQFRRDRWLNPVVFGAFAVLAVTMVVTGQVALGILFAAVFVGIGAWSTWQVHDRLPKIRRVLGTLQQRGSSWTYPADAPTGGTAPAQPQTGAPSPH
ncbi:hypothetical protein DEI81_10175 [Curtobacterium sp. MCBD17_013]|uniref:hypothetical protein n=1 Tax=Curtobacterium sp. MCBD17_013 TaxID=2175668 RepID=UPI000DAAC9AD|nr:hypothetical protein [Curtobacterium sp. MCBD17_013]PZF61760.1 hypothetical protein DEI81_10175 [Curtobacterium sp. MCBD17_013]